MTYLQGIYNNRIFSLFSIAIFFSTSIQAQINLTSRYFDCTTWVVSNLNGLFFKSDTVYVTSLPGNDTNKINDSINIAEYFSNNEFITMDFKKANELILFTTKVDSWSIVKKKGKYTWEFNYSDQALNLYFNGKVFAKFKPVSQNQTIMKSAYTNRPPIMTKTLTMIRLL